MKYPKTWTIEQKREYWKSEYHRRKHLPKYVEARREREKRSRKNIRDKRVFERLAQYQRKRNNADIKAIDLWRLCLRQRGKCALTGRKLTTENMSVDHIVPMANGGSSDISNLRLTIKAANIAKWILTDNELIELCKEIVEYAKTSCCL